MRSGRCAASTYLSGKQAKVRRNMREHWLAGLQSRPPESTTPQQQERAHTHPQEPSCTAHPAVVDAAPRAGIAG
jgi:hypothetical protein